MGDFISFVGLFGCKINQIKSYLQYHFVGIDELILKKMFFVCVIIRNFVPNLLINQYEKNIFYYFFFIA